MHSGKFVFSQVMERIPHWEFQRVARRQGVDSAKLGFTAWEHFSAMVFAQLTFRESLRDIEACLSSRGRSHATWGFVELSDAAPWRTRTSIEPGAFSPSSASG